MQVSQTQELYKSLWIWDDEDKPYNPGEAPSRQGRIMIKKYLPNTSQESSGKSKLKNGIGQNIFLPLLRKIREKEGSQDIVFLQRFVFHKRRVTFH